MAQGWFWVHWGRIVVVMPHTILRAQGLSVPFRTNPPRNADCAGLSKLQGNQTGICEKVKDPVRYSGSTMTDSLRAAPPVESIDPIRLTRQLCEIESTTYHEGLLGDFLADFLSRRRWVVEKTPVVQPSESSSAGSRWNVYAGAAGQTPDLVFSTHLDTVPPYIPFTEDAEFLYGRGVCDAKGILAAQVAAAEALREEGFRLGCCLSAAKSATRPAR
jgi:hypothetical protein